MYGGEDVHLDNPGERFIELEMGGAHGYPFCFTAQNVVVDETRVPTGTQLATEAADFTNPHDDAWCEENADAPLTFLTAHSAPLDLTFHESTLGALPDAWQGGAFVTQHGSWNTMPSVGHRVVLVPFESGSPLQPEATTDATTFPFPVVFGGGSEGEHKNGTWGWSNGDAGEDPVRPVGVAVSPVDGALYISSDSGGVIYRVGLSQN
jgi:glucose/arabinose dehydrogenase